MIDPVVKPQGGLKTTLIRKSFSVTRSQCLCICELDQAIEKPGRYYQFHNKNNFNKILWTFLKLGLFLKNQLSKDIIDFLLDTSSSPKNAAPFI